MTSKKRSRNSAGELVKVSDVLFDMSRSLPALKQNGFINPELKSEGVTALRLVRSAGRIISDGDELAQVYSHTTFCQTGLPYRDPGDEVREWERRNGSSALKIIAGEAWHPNQQEWIKIGLPFGAKARLVQIYCDTKAIQEQNPLVETDHSLTAFVTGKLKLDGGGRTIVSVKDALARFAASTWRIGIGEGEHGRTVNTQIIENFDIWLPKDANQRVIFPSFVQYSDKYFQTLLTHAVPLSMEAIAAISHNAMALDAYRWLAQRLHRIRPGHPMMLMWNVLHEQFGGPARLADFRREFKKAMAEVLTVYPEARKAVVIDEKIGKCKDGRGVWLSHGAPPVKKAQILAG